jgi:uncharacterized coiled-coil DUF342 family protein
MERPPIKDKRVLKYVEDLERQLEALGTQSTINGSYFALKNYIDANNAILTEFKLTVDEVSDKDDKISERTMKFAKELLDYNEDLEKLREKISPEAKEKDRQIASGRSVERHISG